MRERPEVPGGVGEWPRDEHSRNIAHIPPAKVKAQLWLLIAAFRKCRNWSMAVMAQGSILLLPREV